MATVMPIMAAIVTMPWTLVVPVVAPMWTIVPTAIEIEVEYDRRRSHIYRRIVRFIERPVIRGIAWCWDITRSRKTQVVLRGVAANVPPLNLTPTSPLKTSININRRTRRYCRYYGIGSGRSYAKIEIRRRIGVLRSCLREAENKRRDRQGKNSGKSARCFLKFHGYAIPTYGFG
jgi:hypothetical protein